MKPDIAKKIELQVKKKLMKQLILQNVIPNQKELLDPYMDKTIDKKLINYGETLRGLFTRDEH